MKKIIALLLALLMTFSFVPFVFAEEATDAPETSVTNPFEDMTEEEVMNMIMNLDMYQVKMVLKVAKIAVKIAFVFDKLGIIDLSPIKNAILDMVWDLVAGYITPEAVIA